MTTAQPERARARALVPLLRTCAKSAYKYGRPRLLRFVVFRRDLDEPFADVANPLGVKIERLDDFEAKQAANELAGSNKMRRLFRRGLARNWQAYVARLDTRIVGAMFISRDYIVCHNKRIWPLSEDERYSAEALVLPQFRGNKIFTLLKVQAYSEQRAAGVQRIFNMPRHDNGPSLRVHRNIGAREQFGVVLLTWMRMNVYWRGQPRADGRIPPWLRPPG